QAVVVAPAAAAPPPPAANASDPPAMFAPSTDHEDIFAPPDATDDLFGRPEGPRVELPPPAAPPAMDPTLVLDGANPVAPASDQPFGSTLTYAGPGPAPAPAGDATLPSWMDVPAAPEAAALSPFLGSPADAAPGAGS